MALKVLSSENLKHFMTIKTCLVECTILSMNLESVGVSAMAQTEMLKILTDCIFVDKLPNPVLQDGTDKLEEIVFLP